MAEADPNAEALAKVRGDLIGKFRVSNPRVYDKLASEFNSAFSGAVREGVGTGLELAIALANSVAEQAADDDDVTPVGLAYIEGLIHALRETHINSQKKDG